VEYCNQLHARDDGPLSVTTASSISALPVSEAPGIVTKKLDVPSIQVRVFPQWSAVEWNRTIHHLPGRGPIHSGGWADTLIEAYDFRPMYLVAESDNFVCGALPLMEVDSRLTGRRGVSLPFSDACDVLAVSEDVTSALLRAAEEISRERGWKYLESRSARTLPVKGSASCAFVEHVLPLDRTESELWDRCDPVARRGVRKAEQSGVKASIEEGMDAMREYYRLHLLTRRRHGLPPQPWKFFENLQVHVLDKDGGFIVLARRENRSIAGAVFLCSGDRALYKFGASDQKFQTFRANNFVMWEGITRSMARGCSVFSFGRTDPDQDGLRRFKRHWGARERNLEYFYVGRGSASIPAKRWRVPRWANAAFRYVPTPLARITGAVLYRHQA